MATLLDIKLKKAGKMYREGVSSLFRHCYFYFVLCYKCNAEYVVTVKEAAIGDL